MHVPIARRSRRQLFDASVPTHFVDSALLALRSQVQGLVVLRAAAAVISVEQGALCLLSNDPNVLLWQFLLVNLACVLLLFLGHARFGEFLRDHF
ncbi:hypothetical protein L596_029038 [Steinernema carpocapsae]|uniref:Uncharacterized protein n=1 Tax=Steinernema carpocapsae TaxID=34508 RepID=A0A4U5LTF9_STECR|nr:hypothetical protein L596_029038 [Steinernema carpocapsae]